MNQSSIGKFISQKRKEKSMTQEQLAEKLGVSNKTVSKWECGKCMPDYSIVKPLCQELDITVSELLDGEAKMGDTHTDEQILNMLERIQALEKQKTSMTGILLIIMGVALLAFSQMLGGTSFRDFLSGFMTGISIVDMLVGVYVIGSSFKRK